MESGNTGERLREAFASLDESQRAPGACPEPGRIWDAVHAELPPETALEIVDHVAACPSCAADWRIALQSVEQAGAEAKPSSRRFLPASLAAAAAILLAAALFVVFRPGGLPGADPVYRTGGDVEIRSLVSENEPLPRDGAVLRWSPAGEEVLYSVEVGTLELSPVAAGYDLRETEFRVPPDALSSLPAGAVLVWRVEAMLPDGRRQVSEAFLARIE